MLGFIYSWHKQTSRPPPAGAMVRIIMTTECGLLGKCRSTVISMQKRVILTASLHSQIADGGGGRLEFLTATSVPNNPGSPLDPSTSSESADKEMVDGSGHNKDSVRLDPVHWFGVLIPPALRLAQRSFVDVVEGSIPEIVTLSEAMAHTKIEIGRLQKTIKRLETT